MKNPYTRLLELMQKNGAALNPPSILLGEVISVSPLVISVGDTEVDNDNIYIADYLLEDYSRLINLLNIPTIGTVETTMKYTNTFAAGDLLAVLPTIDEQTYIILCRVVSL